ncbi:MAG TPA: serine/threonine-protein kinase [Kofleriaceae bacterium]|nr:serine/threonine-protein kinase [Kofleriaceae bacterium]
MAIGALLVIAGGAAAGYGVTRKATGGLSPQASEAMGSSIAQLDGDVKAARASVKERAATFASLLPVQAAVSTDASTAKDMLVRGELQFSPQAGEVIELGQVTGDKAETLLIQPEGAMHSPHASKAGSYADLMGDKVVITEVAQVTPKEARDGLTGYVMVVRPLDLKPAIDRLVGAGVAGTIEANGEKRTIGSPAPNAAMQTQAIPSLPEMKVIVAVPPKTGGMNMPLAAGGGGLAALGLILLVVGLVAKPAGTAAAAAAAAGTQAPSLGTAATQMSQPGMYATGTPSPVAPSGPIAATDLGPGAMIGRWEIIKRLGSGGMADVYLARAKGEAGFEKTVAVKVMHPHLARMSRAVDHFLDEARLAARIAHPNVVAIQDLGKIGNDYVIVMEYVDGVDLERLLTSARTAQRLVPIDVALGIMCRICDGLNAAHKCLAADGTPLNIVHRDVKSANVLVSKQGGVKVVDFGIAKAAQQGHNTIAGETKGTPSMMAPEQRVGEAVDVRADVYSVAAVAYEILTGHAVNLDLAALAHLGVENWPHLPPPSSLRAQLPAELDGVLLKAMSFERDKRPADCAALEATFEQIMKQYSLTASDKDIARWVQSEVALLSSSQPDAYSQTVAP